MNMTANKQMISQIKLQEAQALAEVTIDDTVATDSDDASNETPSDYVATPEKEAKKPDLQGFAEEAKKHHERKKSSYFVEQQLTDKAGHKVYGLGMPIVPLSPES